MADLVGYRTQVGYLLASAVDSSTWTTAMLDQALRMALDELNEQLVYEGDFTVISAAYEQDLSTITAIKAVVAVAYPWVEGSDFGRSLAAYRSVGVNVIYLVALQPAVGDIIRVRYSKLHVIEDLDSAVATTVPANSQFLVELWAAAHACDLRIRQVSENPALPHAAANVLARMAMTFRKRAQEAVSHIAPLGRLRWGDLGLE